MKITFKLVLAVVLLFSSTSNVFASNLWKECGIGHWVMGPTWHGLPAITTNLVWDLGTTATTSHISTPEICAGPFWAAARFINNTYPLIEEDTAQGSGEHLIAMLDILECDSSAQPAIINDIRSGFAQSVTQPNYLKMSQSEKAEAYYNMVADNVNTKYSAQCDAA